MLLVLSIREHEIIFIVHELVSESSRLSYIFVETVSLLFDKFTSSVSETFALFS